MDRYVCLKESDIIIPEGDEESSSSEEDDDGGDSSDDDEDEDEDEETLLGNEEAPELKDTGGELAEDPVGSMQEMVVLSSNITSTVKQKVSLRDQAAAFMGVSKDTKRSEEDIISTPLPGETLAVFYARSREYFSLHVARRIARRFPYGKLWHLQGNTGLRRRAKAVTTGENSCGAMASRLRRSATGNINLF